MTSLFFSYSHKDEELRDQLEVHLQALKRQKLVDIWHDRRITAGSEWRQQIATHLEEADVILLLVSPDFIASDYCSDIELERALERHHEDGARVIPVILRPCDWENLAFSRLQATPRNGRAVTMQPNQDEAFLEVTQAIKQAIHDLRASTPAAATKVPQDTVSPRVVSLPLEPRSSNLRVRKVFSQHDKDVYLAESFDYISKFFENSLVELSARHGTIATQFRRVNPNTFEAAIYRAGDIASRCRIWFDIDFPGGIAYSTDPNSGYAGGASFNERMSVHADDQQLYLKPLGLRQIFSGRTRDKLSQQGAAEYLWGMLLEPLQ